MQTSITDYATLTLLTLLLGTAVYTDIRFGKIYNKLTLPAMAVGVTLNVVARGLPGLWSSLAGLGVVLLLYLLFASGAGFGGGDIKLMMAVGALLGWERVIWALLYSAAAGGVLALIVLARRGMVSAAFRNILSSLYIRIGLRQNVDIPTVSGGLPFRYSPAIALGTVLAYFIRS